MTGLLIKIESEKIAELLFIELYIERENAITIQKNDLIKVYKDGRLEYYAPVDANRLGRGNLIARAVFEDKERMYPGEVRPVVVSGFTGYSVPCMGEGKEISCGGYAISFEIVNDIPEDDAYIFIGSIKEKALGYEYITEEMIKKLDKRTVEKQQLTERVEEGDRFVVAIPRVCNMRACKDNGFGGKVPFSTTIMGANGLQMKIDDKDYEIYGEFMTVGGNFNIYIE